MLFFVVFAFFCSFFDELTSKNFEEICFFFRFFHKISLFFFLKVKIFLSFLS